MKFVHKDHWMVVQHLAKWLRDQTNLATSAAREKRRRQRMYLSWIMKTTGRTKTTTQATHEKDDISFIFPSLGEMTGLLDLPLFPLFCQCPLVDLSKVHDYRVHLGKHHIRTSEVAHSATGR